ncbi:MAG: cysteine desulfurase [Coriobacteriaceae bacterium]|nr:cysteine desulfurase [Coriobacteriaceae bacterium]
MAEDTPYIYADNAATTPLSPCALEAMMPYLTGVFGNPSGIHRVSREAAEALGALRKRMARLLGARAAGEVYFTSGGSESDNWVLRGAIARFRDLHAGDGLRPCLVTSAVEHHAVLHCCDSLEHEGAEVVRLPVDGVGRVRASDLEAALAAAEGRVALVSIMLANNEVGTVQDIARLAKIAHDHGAPFHTDAVQAVGHIPVSVAALDVDALSLSAHKFHGPHGAGALYLREGFSIPPLITGGAQERGERAGTENLAGVAGMVAALEECSDGLEQRAQRVARLRGRLIEAVVSGVDDVMVTGDVSGIEGVPASDGHKLEGARGDGALEPADGLPWRRLPSIASFACHDVDGELLMVLLDRAGVAAATGSACATGSTDPSHVAVALGIEDPRWNHGTLRLSLADDVSEEEVEALCERVPACIKRCRMLSGTIA